MNTPDASDPSADDGGSILVPESRYENLFVGHVLPIVKFRRAAEGQYDPIAMVGSGFTFGENTLVTCWHCVAGELGDGEVYAVAYRSGGTDQQGYDSVSELTDLEQDANGHDLALATIGFALEPVLTLADEPAAWGEDVVASGYPLPLNTRDPSQGTALISTNACILKGYVTRLKPDDRPGLRLVRAYELDMPAPPGVSGSPLFRPRPLEVVGVVYGEQDIEVAGSKRLITFSYAHHLSTLRDARGRATDNLPLGEFLMRGA